VKIPRRIIIIETLLRFIASLDARAALLQGSKVTGWAGPGKGVIEMPAEKWHPYSPANFVTPPFPGYVPGHSTVSAAAAKVLELFTGSNRFGEIESGNDDRI